MAKLKALVQTPPPARGDSEQQIAELRDYLYTIVEEVSFFITQLNDRQDSAEKTVQDAIEELAEKISGLQGN